MKRKMLVCILSVAAAATAQVQRGKTRPLFTKDWMRGVNGPHCIALNNLLKEPGPSDEKAWAAAAQHTAVLNESSHVLMADGRCPDSTWADVAKQLREGSEAVLKAIEEKKRAGTAYRLRGRAPKLQNVSQRAEEETGRGAMRHP